MKIYEAHAVPGEGTVVREVEGKVHRARVARVDGPNVVLEHVANARPFEIGCVVIVRRQGVTLVGYVTPTLINRETGVLHLEGFPVLAGDELQVAKQLRWEGP
jgi:hypothetical protein